LAGEQSLQHVPGRGHLLFAFRQTQSYGAAAAVVGAGAVCILGDHLGGAAGGAFVQSELYRVGLSGDAAEFLRADLSAVYPFVDSPGCICNVLL